MKRIVILIVSLIIVVICIAVVIRSLRPGANINLVLSPTAAKVVLDGQAKLPAGKQRVAQGKHTITVSFAGFSTKTVSFIAPNKSVKTITVYLNTDSQAGIDYLNSHPGESAGRQAISDQNFSNEAHARQQTNPILAILPHIDNFYRIDYGISKEHPNDTSAVGIYITYYSEDGKNQALQWLQYEGYDPNTLEIIYQDKTSEGFN